MSRFYDFNASIDIIYFNVYVYKAVLLFYIAFENVTMLIASKFWFKVIKTKYIIAEGDDPSKS